MKKLHAIYWVGKHKIFLEPEENAEKQSSIAQKNLKI